MNALQRALARYRRYRAFKHFAEAQSRAYLTKLPTPACLSWSKTGYRMIALHIAHATRGPAR